MYAPAHPRGRADAALEAVADHPGAAADVALVDRAVRRRVERSRSRARGGRGSPFDVVEDAVPRLGDDRQAPACCGRLRSAAATSASWTAPTESVLVSPIGVVSSPDSCIHCRPVSSPLPFSRNGAANRTGSRAGTMTVTPVRTSSPSTSVVCPTRTPATSVIALKAPGSRSPMAMPELASLHARITASTSSRFRSISSCVRASRFSRRSGSVLDGLTLKCQSVGVHGDAVEVGNRGLLVRSAP